ncbi:DUF7426 family protein [Streptomyces alfalfae]|uniref:DUF7426 family protein n=1 Tax=Streptomyces alfalfae TaxID=1642299 RepID=UPI0028122D58|nr:hypothetical protein [Streptomyces alfalfae]
MSARFQALDELFDEALELPVKGKTYKIASPSGNDGLRIQRITTLAARLMSGGEAVDTEVLNDEEEQDLLQMCLGSTYQQMLDDGVDWSWIKHAGLTAMFWITSNLDTAQQFWEAAGDPSQFAPGNRAERRKKAKKSGSAAASSTKRRGSTSGTSARRATASAPQAVTT